MYHDSISTEWTNHGNYSNFNQLTANHYIPYSESTRHIKTLKMVCCCADLNPSVFTGSNETQLCFHSFVAEEDEEGEGLVRIK